MLGSTISHYTILEKLGEGGMGLVYKARDLKLDRFVALKFLPPDVASDSEELARLLHEAKAISSLNHPNIATIHSLEEEGEHKFLVLEYIEGGTLRQKLKERQLTLDEVSAYAIQIAAGLDHAHRKGIVHRDIKTDNVMLTGEGQVKITDFGLAKLRGVSRITKTGTTVGTAAYMSPEQARGEDLDHRSDIFSFGIVLFELMTGSLPFKGDHEAALIYEIVHEPPQPINELRPDAPSRFDEIVLKALEKRPDERFQTVDDISSALKRLQRVTDSEIPHSGRKVGRKGATKRRILVAAGIIVMGIGAFLILSQKPERVAGKIPVAVADFTNETNEEAMGSLSGLLITALEQSRQLSVLTRSGMFDALKAIGKGNIDHIDESYGKEICLRSNIGILVIPTIRKFGKNYSVDAKLLDPMKNEYVYTVKESGTGQESITDMIDRISEEVRTYLKEDREELRASSQAVGAIATRNLEAYKHYFKGDEYIVKWMIFEADTEYQKALALDSTFGLAHFRLAYISQIQGRGMLTDPALARARVNKAVEYIDDIPDRERKLLNAINAGLTQGPPIKLRELIEVEKAYPQDKEILLMITDAALDVDSSAVARRYLEPLFTLDSTDNVVLYMLLSTYAELRDTQKFVELGRFSETLDRSDLAQLRATEWYSLGKLDSSLAILQRWRLKHPDSLGVQATYVYALVLNGQYEEADIELERWNQQGIAAGGYNYTRYATDLYLGRYRDAMRRTWAKPGDKYALAIRTMLYAQLSSVGWNKYDTSWKKAVEASRWPEVSAHTNPLFWLYYAKVSALKGDEHSALRMAREQIEPKNKSRADEIYSIVASVQDDYDLAWAIADSNMKSNRWNVAQIARTLYPLAISQLRNSQFDEALITIRKIQSVFAMANGEEGWFHFPRCIYLLGKVYDAQGKHDLARQEYRKLLRIWRTADKDLIEYVDAKKRLAVLEERK